MDNKIELSIVTCTFNGGRTIKDFIESLFMQDYPLKKLEILIADGGSKDGTINIIDYYKKRHPKTIKLMNNPMQYAEGRGMGKDMLSRKAKGEFIIFLDQDNILIQKDWLRKMAEIVKKDKSLSAVQSRAIIPKKGTSIDKYLGLVGIEDPFAIPYSLLSQIALKPRQFVFDKKIESHVYKVNRKNFLYAGNNGFLIRKRDFLKSGGYTQDIDNFYRMSSGNFKIAVPLNIGLYHKSSNSFTHFLKKRSFYVKHYLLKNISERDFYWFSLSKNTFRQNFKFVRNVLCNLIFLPAAIQGIRLAIRDKELSRLIHPVILWSITLNYIYCFLYTRLFKEEGLAKI